MVCECARKARAESRLRQLLEDWPKYLHAKLETFKPKSVGQENAHRAIRENPTASYLICGGYSTGKTHLLVAQYRHVALSGQKCLLRAARDLIDELTKAEVSVPIGQQPPESQVLQMIKLSPVGHLFIDDIEKAPARTGFRVEMLFDLFDSIDRRMLALSVTSNLPIKSQTGKPDLRGALSDQVVSRLYRICKVIEL